MRRHFHKMHGLGNDFVIVDARDAPFEVTPDLARAIADRRTGIGCDQLIVLEPSDRADLRMRIWNPDGGEGASRGHPARRVAWLLGGQSAMETAGGTLKASAEQGGASVAMGEPHFAWDEIPLAYPMDTDSMPVARDERRGPAGLNVGNPHVVFFVEASRAVPLDRLGPLIETD